MQFAHGFKKFEVEMNDSAQRRTPPRPRPRLAELVTEIRASKARLLLLQWVYLATMNRQSASNSDGILAATWELEPRSVRRARTWLVAHNLIAAERRSRGIRYELLDAGAEVTEAVERSITASRSGSGLRAAMRSIMRHCAEFKGAVAEVAAVFGVQVTSTLREAVAYAVAYDGIGCADYADASYNLGRKARGFSEKGETFGRITAEQWLYRMAKKWRWIPTEADAVKMKERRVNKPSKTYEVQVEQPPQEYVPILPPTMSKVQVANAAAVCGEHNWRILKKMQIEQVSQARVLLNAAPFSGLSAKVDLEAVEAAQAAFEKEWRRKHPDCEVKFVYAFDSGRPTIEEVAKRL
jgi:DNA-binding transcriptional ArsR family regulator